MNNDCSGDRSQHKSDRNRQNIKNHKMFQNKRIRRKEQEIEDRYPAESEIKPEGA